MTVVDKRFDLLIEMINESTIFSNLSSPTPSDVPHNACICELANEHFSHSDYHDFNLYLIVVTLPLIATFGIITNFISFLIFTRGQLIMNSTDYYLAALAISDIMVDWCGLFVIAVDSARRFDELLTKIHLLIIPYILPLGYMSQMCSVYFTVFAAIDCYICIRKPTSKFCRPQSTKVTLYLIVFLTFLYNGVTFWELEIVNCVDYEIDPNKLRQEICPTLLRLDPIYMQVYKVYSYALVMAFVPFTFLLVLNCLIILFVYTRKSNRKSSSATTTRLTDADGLCRRTTIVDDDDAVDSPSKIDECQIDGDSTITLVMVVVLFLVCNSVGFAVNIIETFGSANEQGVDSQIRLMFVVDAGNFLVVLNSSANFLIYAAFSKPFRSVLIKALKKYKEKFINLITSNKRRATNGVAMTLTSFLSNGTSTANGAVGKQNQSTKKLVMKDSSTDDMISSDCPTNDTCLIIDNRKVTTMYQACEILPLNFR